MRKQITRHAKTMQSKSTRCKVTETGIEGLYQVLSPSGNTYFSDLNSNTCTCDWHLYHKGTSCSHLMAAQTYAHQQESGRRMSFWTTEDDALRQHRPIAPMADVWATSRVAA